MKRGSEPPAGPYDTPTSSVTGPLSSRAATFAAARGGGETTGTGTATENDTPSPATTHTAAQRDAAAAASKRRRGAGIVTPIACTECRKKRSKCNGGRPCSRCKSLSTECIYEIPVRQSKEMLRHELEELRRSQKNSEKVISALVRPDPVAEAVAAQYRNGRTVDSIAEWLDNALPGDLGLGGPAAGSASFTGFGSGTGMGMTTEPAKDNNLSGGAPRGAAFGTTGERGQAAAPMSPQQRPPRWPSVGSSTSTTSNVSLPPMRSALGMSASQSLAEFRGRDAPFNGGQPAGFFRSSGDMQNRPLAAPAGSVPYGPVPPVQGPSPWAQGQGQGQGQGHGQSRIWPTSPPVAQETEQQPSPMDWDTTSPGGMTVGNGTTAGAGVGISDGLDRFMEPEVPEVKVSASSWTRITSDSRLVNHLLALYFCWEYPTFASLSKEHFLRDFQNGKLRYCSPMLVNALLSLGCRFSSQPNTRADDSDDYSAGDHFFKESLRLYHEETDHHSFTTIQALGIMSIREASCGRDSESWYYSGQSMRLALEMGLHLTLGSDAHQDDIAVRAATFWGAFALDQAWCLATGTLPQLSCSATHPPTPAIIPEIESSSWQPYTDDGVPLEGVWRQPSNVGSVYKCFCGLSSLVHESLYILHCPGQPVQASDILNIYHKYVGWYNSVPEALRLGRNYTPSVLFAHMYFQFALLMLFRPLMKLRIIGTSVVPRDICSQAADAIQGLTRSYARLYTLRRTPSFVPYFVLGAAIVHLALAASEPPDGADNPSSDAADSTLPLRELPSPPINHHAAEVLRRALMDLAEMAPCHHFAEQGLNILRSLGKRWAIDLAPTDEVTFTRGKAAAAAAKVEATFAPKHFGNNSDVGNPRSESTPNADDPYEGPDSAFKFTFSEKSTRARGTSLNFFATTFTEEDLMGSGPLRKKSTLIQEPKAGVDPGERMQVEGGGAQTKPVFGADVEENPLFWPFPFQGKPMLPAGKALRDAGFEML